MLADIRGKRAASVPEVDHELNAEIMPDGSAEAARERFEVRLETAVDIAVLIAVVAVFLLATLALVVPL